jgi:hypothetical protein
MSKLDRAVGVSCALTKIEKGIVPCFEKELKMNGYYEDICIKATPLQPLPEYTPVDHSMTRYFTFKEHREMQAWRNQLKRREEMAAEFWKRSGRWAQVWSEIDEALWKILRDWKTVVLDKIHPEQVDPKVLCKRALQYLEQAWSMVFERFRLQLKELEGVIPRLQMEILQNFDTMASVGMAQTKQQIQDRADM